MSVPGYALFIRIQTWLPAHRVMCGICATALLQLYYGIKECVLILPCW